ncbi:hypothetical protein, partial [Rheinheimera baltica]|uniref:hypothetical protein n=1 Tax=Rheinheimera baltica TaxID=67576 RepID=UPI00273ED058
FRGPESPIVECLQTGQRVSVWDRWCHFERPGYVSFFLDFGNSDNARADFEILSEIIDYAVCSRPFSFDGVKVFKVCNVYGLDCEIEVI